VLWLQQHLKEGQPKGETSQVKCGQEFHDKFDFAQI
jgi:hypothetical protein